MVNKLKQAMVGKIEGLELDPLVWQELPQELLERVITKLPFSRVVAFRTVCKLWHLEIIPRVAPNVQASNKSALLYFGFPRNREVISGWKQRINEGSQGLPWWFRICSESEWAGSKAIKRNWRGFTKMFQQKSFPSPSKLEKIELVISEQGHLFFCFIDMGDKIVRDLFVCNPLTSQSRSLGLPHPLRPPFRTWDAQMLVGAVFDSKTGSYHLVVAGVNGSGEHVTFLYDSSTSAWTTGSSLLPAVLKIGQGVINLPAGSSRSVSCNGNLYWHAVCHSMDAGKYMLKFDVQLATWVLIRDPIVCNSQTSSLMRPQMTSYEGDILLWHLHRHPYQDIYQPGVSVDWPCRSDLKLKLVPEIKFMERHLIERVDEFLRTQILAQENLCLHQCEYLAFSQQNFIYHVFLLLTRPIWDCRLQIVVQDTNENSLTELPFLLEKRFPAHHFSPSNVWGFSASLTSLP